MKKQQEEKQIIDIDDFHEYVSLNNIIDAGGDAVAKLKKIADSFQFDQYNQLVRFPTLLITGQGQGKSTLAKAFLNSLCLEVKEIDASLINSANRIIEFFWASHPDRAYILTNVENLPTLFHKTLYEILQKHEYTILNQYSGSETRYPVSSVIVMTTSDFLKVPSPLLKHTHYIINHTEHDNERRELIAIQRFRNANVRYSQQGIKKIVKETPNLKSMIDMVRMCLDIVKSDYRDNLTIEDVSKAIKLMYGD